VPPGFAHGFLVTSDSAEFLYKTTDYYAPEYERCIAWNDQDIRVEWPLALHAIAEVNLSVKDQQGQLLKLAYPTESKLN
jgi:dTDP-4-dehydrorhamnose 3,5-epimerase